MRFAKLHLFSSGGGSSAVGTPSATAPTVDDALREGPKLFGFTAVRSFDGLAEVQLEHIATACAEARAEAAALAAVDGVHVRPAGGSSSSASGGANSDRPRTAADVLRTTNKPVESFPALPPNALANACAVELVETPLDEHTLEELAFLDAADALVRERRRVWAEADSKVPSAPRTQLATDAALPAVGAAAADGSAASGGGALGADGAEDGGDEGGRLVLQAADGQLVFADALSARMLLEENGRYASPRILISTHLHVSPRISTRLHASLRISMVLHVSSHTFHALPRPRLSASLLSSVVAGRRCLRRSRHP